MKKNNSYVCRLLSPCHRPKKTCGVGGHPTRSGLNILLCLLFGALESSEACQVEHVAEKARTFLHFPILLHLHYCYILSILITNGCILDPPDLRGSIFWTAPRPCLSWHEAKVITQEICSSHQSRRSCCQEHGNGKARLPELQG